VFRLDWGVCRIGLGRVQVRLGRVQVRLGRVHVRFGTCSGYTVWDKLNLLFFHVPADSDVFI
jgi:hypothetical protein